MSNEPAPGQEQPKSLKQVIAEAFRELGTTLIAFIKAPRALWGINIPYVIEGLTYFGLLTILGKFGSENCGLDDLQAGWVYGGVTGGITLAMLLLGGVSDKIGVRGSLFISLAAMAVGRSVVALSDTVTLANGMFSPQFFVMCAGLLLMVTAYGLYMPAAYAGVKRYTNPQTAAVGYAVIYGLMNLGAFFSGFISPITRQHFEKLLPPNGLAAVFWVYAGLTFAGSLITLLIITKKTDRQAVEQVKVESARMKSDKESKGEGGQAGGREKETAKAAPSSAPRPKSNPIIFLAPFIAALAVFGLYIAYSAGAITLPTSTINLGVLGESMDAAGLAMLGLVVLFGLLAVALYLKARPDHPFRDSRFVFFIFILMPVQTLFAHNWLTIPYYLDRTFVGTAVSDYFEFFSNLNPIIIFVMAPIIAGLTARANIYRMMIAGTFVMAAPTILLAIGPNVWLFVLYIVIMSVGEAMWQPRFLQWIAEIAPEGKTGAYMGIGQMPWFLTKVLTSFYSGWFVAHYIPMPVEGPGGVPVVTATDTGQLWLIYTFIALVSPVALILAKRWMVKGMRGKASN